MATLFAESKDEKGSDLVYWSDVLETDEPIGLFTVAGTAANRISKKKTGKLTLKGGPGSGFHGHPGGHVGTGGKLERGGSQPSGTSEENIIRYTPQELAKHLKSNLGDLRSKLLQVRARTGTTMFGVGMYFTMDADPEVLKSTIGNLLKNTFYGIERIIVNDVLYVSGGSKDVVAVEIRPKTRLTGEPQIQHYKQEGNEAS